MDATYDSYVIVASGFVAGGTSSALVTSRAYIGGSWITTGYQYSTTELIAGGTVSALTSDSDINAKLASDLVGGVNAAPFNATIWVYNPGSTTLWKQVAWEGSLISYAGGNNTLTSTMGAYSVQNTAALTGFRLGLTSGTWQAGTLRLYGVSNS